MTEQLNSNKTVDLWKVLTAIAVVGSTLAVGGWVVGRAYLQDEISQYKETEKWKAPDVIRKITTLSERLSKQLDSISDYEALAKYKIYATGEIKRLTNLNQEIKQVNKNKLMEIERNN